MNMELRRLNRYLLKGSRCFKVQIQSCFKSLTQSTASKNPDINGISEHNTLQQDPLSHILWLHKGSDLSATMHMCKPYGKSLVTSRLVAGDAYIPITSTLLV